MGMLPNSQFGDIAVVDVSSNNTATSVVEGTSGLPITVGVALSGSSTANFISSTAALIFCISGTGIYFLYFLYGIVYILF